MLNVHSSPREHENAAASTPLTLRHRLTVRLDAGACALPRLINLMAKLDIEPDRMQVEKSPCGESLSVAIDLGADREPMERLALRLSGMVTVRDVMTGLAA